ncbi:MAG: phosphoenolpyruvate synthase, partial [Candidatus Thermoplasmatota archaeon]
MGTPSAINNMDYSGDYKPSFHRFYDLMKFKVNTILLVSSLYDAFTLEEDGLLGAQISGRYSDLELSSPPQIIRVSSGREALGELERMHYDLVITMSHLIDMDPFEFGRRAKEVQKGVPVVMLVTEAESLPAMQKRTAPGIDRVFYWSGDSALLLAIVKHLEDVVNVDQDTRLGNVRVILVIEDSPRYYSIFLPIIYTEVVSQTQALIAEGLNENEKLLMKRARPKILLAGCFEEAMRIYERYRDYILAVITDVTFPCNGKEEEGAGFRFITAIDRGVPVLLQSLHAEHGTMAKEMGIAFLDKNSETLLNDLRGFFKEHLGFGDFVFRMPDGAEVGRAGDIREFIEVAQRVPADSLLY